MSKRADVVIVGAGHAGANTALFLRQLKFTRSILLVTEEPDPPYERPPLSKDYLSGERDFERILIRPAHSWLERGIELAQDHRVDSVDVDSKAVYTSQGNRFEYGALVWATGGHARRLSCPGHDLTGVHVLRNRVDVDCMKASLDRVQRVVVIGGGYIGLEAASALRKMGKRVTLVEAMDRVLARVAGAPLSGFYEAEHRSHGVDVRLNARVECILEEHHRAVGVRLADGEELVADIVVVGIGIVPAVEQLLNAGAKGGNGVLVDEFGRTSLTDVFAAGDCALHANPFADGELVRLESVQNAADMAAGVARAISGSPSPYRAVPWFWSNQYDLRLQTVGLSLGHDEIIVRGDQSSRSFSVIYKKQGRVIALDCVNSAKDYTQGRALVLNRVTVPASVLADCSKPLKSLSSTSV